MLGFTLGAVARCDQQLQPVNEAMGQFEIAGVLGAYLGLQSRGVSSSATLPGWIRKDTLSPTGPATSTEPSHHAVRQRNGAAFDSLASTPTPRALIS